MVYESDFYTTRRPYSRPTVTSYSVTDHGIKLPGLGKGQTFHRNIPSVGHKRLVIVTPSAHSVRSRPSVLMGEMDRIYHKIRPSLAYQPTEDYLNSRSMVSFDDETRSIRAKTADILKRIHTPVPRAQRPLPLPGEAEVTELPVDWHDSFDWYPEELGQTRLRLKLLSLKRDLAELNTGAYYSHSELPLTERITSDNYIDRLLSGTRNVARDINVMSHYEEPAKHSIGRGHLACVSYAGGRPIAKRRNLATDDYIKDDINVLSHYGRFRAAAAAATVPPTEPEYAPPLHRPPTKSAVTGSWKSNAPRAQKEAKTGNLTAAEEFDASQDRKQRRREAVEAAAMREVEEEKRRKQELNRQDDLAQQALVEREQELARKAREDEEAALQKAENDRIEAERLAKEEEERLLREEEERLAAEEQKLIEEEEARKRQEEEEKKAKKAKKEAEKRAKEEAERKAKEEEEERKRKEEEERKAKEEAEQKAREEEERLKKEEEERKAKEEEEQRAREEAERQAKEEADRLAKEEADRLAKEEADRLAAEEAAKAAEEVSEEPTAEETEAVPESATEEAQSEAPTEAEPAVENESQAADEPVVEEPVENETPEVDNAEEVLSEEAEE